MNSFVPMCEAIGSWHVRNSAQPVVLQGFFLPPVHPEFLLLCQEATETVEVRDAPPICRSGTAAADTVSHV